MSDDDEWLNELCRPELCRPRDPTDSPDSKPGPTDAKADEEWLNALCRPPGPTDAKADEAWLHELINCRAFPAASRFDARWLQTLSAMSLAPAASGVANPSTGTTDVGGTSTGSREELAPDTATDADVVGTSTDSPEELVMPDTARARSSLPQPTDRSIVWEHLFHSSARALLLLPHGVRMRQARDHCSLHIHRRLCSMGLAIFKIGIAADPEHRFSNLSFGYVHDGYMFMDVLWRGSAFDACSLEDELITYFKSKRGCQNQNRGGGGVDPNNTSYHTHVYAVFAPCGDGIGVMAAARKRRLVATPYGSRARRRRIEPGSDDATGR